MRVRGGRLRLGLFAVVFVLLCVNAVAPWGEQTAQRVFTVLQAIAGLGAIVCALVVMRRKSGLARFWRLAVVAACVSSMVGDLLRYAGRDSADGTAPPLAVAAYFMPPVLTLVIAVLLVRSGGCVPEERDGPIKGSRVIVILDGLVSAITFSLLVLISGLGDRTGAVLPRSANTAVLDLYALLELVVVVTAVLTAITYRKDRAYRTSYLLLAGGVVTIASSDRMVTYLRTVGLEGAQLWGSIGFVLGLVLIAYAVLDLSPFPATKRGRDAVDWVQLALPYVGFLGMAVLYSFHIYIGESLSAFELSAAVVLVLLVAVRQMIAMRSQRQLTERLYEAQGSLAHQVHHDSLTGLPNRLLFGQRLDHAIRSGPFVLIFVDLDDFKEVNDRFGHAGGDELLCAVGERLQRCIGESDTLARIGGDEFAILIDGELEAPEVVADGIRVALRDPFAIHGSSIRVRASMGLVRPEPGEPPPTSDDLLRQADVSMYAGKRGGKDTAVIYRPSLGVSTDFPTALRQANGGIPAGFSLVYQPVVGLPDTTPVAVEALARWTAPNGTDIQPDAFVAAAEAAGLGAALDVMVLDLACSELLSAGVDLVLHVNIGAARLGSPDFERAVRRTLERRGWTPSQLVLEITETVPVVDLADAAAQISRLNAMGIKVALDDFGAGYSSLTYLHALPVQIIKLDRGLAVGPESDRIETLYRSVIRLCDSLGLDVIAEGIESTAQVDTVFAAGCRLAQGHLFGRAVPIGDPRFGRPITAARQHSGD
ncbi:putative bifunctional diguanylate cyclase/phosphodiesterase [Mycolicibacterium stellerae]|uniref:putative bifunctional diguanylate cyclase/phosphodiesterase n=1 Tax=Mycolicibacterium stellerae TaxID=2358193 RepID=UPI000F0B9E3B|nr:EAL domain-containing protein [Mycolicibacterium stellerae]